MNDMKYTKVMYHFLSTGVFTPSVKMLSALDAVVGFSVIHMFSLQDQVHQTTRM